VPHHPPRLDDQLCFAVYAASRTIVQAYQPMLKSLGLTYPQFLVMMVLWEEDGLSVSAVGDRLLLDSGTLTPLLKRLEQAGMLRRQRAQDDERRVHIFLSDEGSALSKQAAVKHHELLCALDDGTEGGLHELGALRDQLRSLTTTLRA